MADLDFLGVQYYTRLRAPWLPIPGLWTVPSFGGGDPVRPGCTSLGWEIDPSGLGMVLDAMHAYGSFPRLVVTEGGASFDDRIVGGRVHDPRRIAYYESHIAQVLAARERGVPVDGYFAWSLLDNFEWAEGAGAALRPGLTPTTPPRNARSKDSGYWFAEQLGEQRARRHPERTSGGGAAGAILLAGSADQVPCTFSLTGRSTTLAGT